MQRLISHKEYFLQEYRRERQCSVTKGLPPLHIRSLNMQRRMQVFDSKRVSKLSQEHKKEPPYHGTGLKLLNASEYCRQVSAKKTCPESSLLYHIISSAASAIFPGNSRFVAARKEYQPQNTVGKK